MGKLAAALSDLKDLGPADAAHLQVDQGAVGIFQWKRLNLGLQTDALGQGQEIADIGAGPVVFEPGKAFGQNEVDLIVAPRGIWEFPDAETHTSSLAQQLGPDLVVGPADPEFEDRN